MRVDVSSPIAERRHNFSASTAPTVNDDAADGYGVGSLWVDTTTDLVWQCVDATATAAIWDILSNTDLDGIDSETLSRDSLLSTSLSMTSGSMRLGYFTQKKTKTITKMVLSTGGTAAGATPTLVRSGVFTVAANGDLALVAAIASNTSLLATIDELYEPALSSGGGLPTSYTLRAGSRYAFGLLVVTGAATPTQRGTNAMATKLAVRSPRRAGLVSGQTDLPTSVSAGSVTDSGILIWIGASA